MHTYIATAPNGDILKRKTDRIYTHVIGYRRNYDAERATSKAWCEQDGKNWDYRQQMMAGTHRNAQSYFSHNEWRKEYAEFLIEHPDRQGYIDKRHADRLAAIEKRKADGAFERYEAHTWCGRVDLAQKALARARSFGLKDATMIAVQVKS